MEIYFIIQVLVVYLVTCSATVCPNSSTSAIPDFFNEFAEIYYVRNGHSIPLYCCAHGYDNITWWRRIEQSWESFPPLPDGDYNLPRLEEHQQVLRLYSAKLPDNTTFKCQLFKNGLIVKERELQLVVVACDPLARGPLLIPPFPQNYTIDHFGEKMVLSCTGYFGCFSTDLIQIVQWTMKGSDKNLMEISSRYNVSRTESYANTVISSQFTITSVQQEDLDRTFFCTIFNEQKIDGQTVTVVKLSKRERPNLVFIISISVGSVLGAVVLTLLLVQYIGKLYGPQIRLYINSRLPGLAPTPVTVRGQEHFIHNAFIFHAEDDHPMAANLRKKLVQFNYDVFICGDVTGNQARQAMYQKECCRSAMILFLYTDDLRRDPLANFFLHGLIEFRVGKGIMFLEVSKYEPQTIQEWTRQRRNVVNGNVNLFEVDPDIADFVNASEIEQLDIDDDIRFWRALPRLRVPMQGASQRQEKNFWAALQNKIPWLPHQIKHNQRRAAHMKLPGDVHNSISERPLLLPSPTSALTPQSDVVFTYPQIPSNIEHNPVCDVNLNVAVRAQNENMPIDENQSLPIIVDVIHDTNIIQGTSNGEQSNSLGASSSIGCNNLPLSREISEWNESGYAGSSLENSGISPCTVGSNTSGFSGDDCGFLMSGKAHNNYQTSGIRNTDQQITDCD